MRTTDWEGEKKVCAICNKAKIPSEFYKDNSNDDGLQIKCKQCERELRQARDRIPKTKGIEQPALIPVPESEEGILDDGY